MSRYLIRGKMLPKSVAGGSVREKAKKLYGRWWRPERDDKRFAYQMVDIFLEANPDVKFSDLVDLALLTLFSHKDHKAKEMFEAEKEKLNIVFPWVD